MRFAKDEILPEKFSKLNNKNIPARAMLLISAISFVIPYLGRTAIGWIVDVTTVGATLIYGFISAGAMKSARKKGDKKEKITGFCGLVIMVIFGAYLLIPNIFSVETLATETYFLFIVWSILGFIYFRRIISKDHARRFGKAIVVWLVLLSLVVFMAIIWTNRIEEHVIDSAIESIQGYYEKTADPDVLEQSPDEFIDNTIKNAHSLDTINTLVVISLFALSLGIMLINYFSMKKWENKALMERDMAREVAYRDPLTGVKSKHAFVDKEIEIDEKIERGLPFEFGVIVCDVNGLKHINDTLGHKAGDEYIKSACMLICEYFPRGL